ncbi:MULTISPECIES: lysine biosynthesis protein LysW [unclassified Streptomyces]|uniref:lysine biosynthesis protein LysW n=1 Tax=unclassified Streptomyces TaxID=2593676 RepID=UPI000DBA7216|nr:MULTISPECIES: lysine biosynthesis protein LysW [Streptomyces]MYU06243.1 lysine biosynthesis protein LysW [Streptomyces sp. SID8366]MYU63706.1 lysine biosynthesis protein LysW [Streptomyces sp. SID69]RAJ53629.1 alpha-aminoadipate carrier protein LysW [Streptomyces sp. PsTaAH-130]TXJ74017.1 lysine biosynthesis protein LysW [Streptomyces lavendulae]
MSTATLTGDCPECETDLTVPPMVQGETLSCPECMLTLRVEEIQDGRLSLQMVEVQLRDWGQ